MNNINKTFSVKSFLVWACLITTTSILCAQFPKREFRGTWIHTVGNRVYQNMNPDQMRSHYVSLLDSFERAGMNAVIFQIRPQADAFYINSLEPWSRFITGTQGVAPNPIWDPLQFMIDQCHSRGMELHAWLNPYRVTSSASEQLHPSHLFFKRPDLFVKYGDQLYFDPGEPDSRAHTLAVISDIVTRYDVDGIHFDDYFYPYRVEYQEFPDEASFLKYHTQQGFGRYEKNDWRRNNVNILVKQLSDTIKAIKPWVKLGISPFCVWRNARTDSLGSQTNTAQTNYDDLFADILLWVKEGWIDYNAPQLYYSIGHRTASYEPLIDWWSKNNYGVQLYLGQSLSSLIDTRMADGTVEQQLHRKMKMMRITPNVHGNIWWSGYGLASNPNGIIDSLANSYQKYPSLIPAYIHIDSTPPGAAKNLKVIRSRGVTRLVWQAPSAATEMDKAVRYCVYRFEPKETFHLENAEKIVKITGKNEYIIPAKKENKEYLYVVTALDRMWNESGVSNGVRVKH